MAQQHISTSKKIGFLGLATTTLSAIYIVEFFAFALNDSVFHSRYMTSLSCQLYGLGMVLLGGAMAYYSIGKEGLHQTMKDVTYSSTKEILLDEMNEVEGKPPINRADINTIWVLNAIHLFSAFFLAAGELLRFEDAVVVVLGFVYAMLWMIMGWEMFSPLYKGTAGNAE